MAAAFQSLTASDSLHCWYLLIVSLSCKFFFICDLFIHLFFGRAGSLLLCVLSLVVASEDYPLAAVHGLLIAVASFVAKHRF